MLFIGLHVTPEAASFHGGSVIELDLSTSGVVVIATASTRPVLSFRNFALRCDKSNPTIAFETPWNWEFRYGKRIAIIANNSFLKYQLIACMAGLVPPVSGEIIGDSVIGWPVGGDGGLDRKMRISDAVEFLLTVYADCFDRSHVSIEQFWSLLSDVDIKPKQIIKELSRDQRNYFCLSLSVLFAFDCYLIPKTKFLMSKPARQLKLLLLEQIKGKSLFTTSPNSKFQREFCTDGIVLGPLGQVLFSGDIVNVIQWVDKNLGSSSASLESDGEDFDADLNLINSEAAYALEDWS